MGNTHSSSPSHKARGGGNRCRDRCHNKRPSRTNSGLSDSTTSTTSSRHHSALNPPIPNNISLSTSRKQHKHRSSRANNLMETTTENIQEKTPIRIGYPYYEDVAILAEKDKKRKRGSFRRHAS